MFLYFYITGVHQNIDVCVLLILEICATVYDGQILQLMLVSSSMIVASLQKTERVETDPRTAPASRRQRRACRCWSCWRGRPSTWTTTRSSTGLGCLKMDKESSN